MLDNNSSQVTGASKTLLFMGLLLVLTGLVMEEHIAENNLSTAAHKQTHTHTHTYANKHTLTLLHKLYSYPNNVRKGVKLVESY